MNIRYSKEFFDKVLSYFPETENREMFKLKLDVIVNINLKNFPKMYAQNLHFNHRIFTIDVKSQKYLIAYSLNDEETEIIIADMKHEKERTF